MKIDVDGIQGMLDIYRSALENKIPVAPGLQEYFTQNRRQLFEGFKKMTSGQMLLLQSLSPESEYESAQLDEAKRIVDDFGKWAEGE